MNNEFKQKDVESKGRYLAKLLRHDIEAYEKGKIDEHGWRHVDELLKIGFDLPLLEQIVEINNKKRYEFNADHTLIRARQGHSIPVDVELERSIPPRLLYHGTSESVKDNILRDGIKSMARLYVHLSKDIETAIKVGKRHGDKVVVFGVDSGKMESDGQEFFLSRNDVWLTKFVDPKYIKELRTENTIS